MYIKYMQLINSLIWVKNTILIAVDLVWALSEDKVKSNLVYIKTKINIKIKGKTKTNKLIEIINSVDNPTNKGWVLWFNNWEINEPFF